jgi:hypothetical protein
MAHFAYDCNPAKTVDYRQSNIQNNRFFAWTGENMYRTSYATSYTNKPQEPKNNIIPGYAGFVPGLKSEAKFGTSYAQAAKESFSNPTLGNNKFQLSSTGFNLNKQLLADETLTASSHKYGAQTMQKTHPNLDAKRWRSHTQDTHKNPLETVAPTYRPAPVNSVNPSQLTKKSGYETNSICFDGRGLLPNEESADARRQTEYRVRFNGEKPFHLNHTTYMARKMNPFRNTFNI